MGKRDPYSPKVEPCLDGIARPSWRDVEGVRLYHVRPGTPILICPLCGARVCPVLVNENVLNVDLMENAPLWDNYANRHKCLGD
jgi:hypothetical protein